MSKALKIILFISLSTNILLGWLLVSRPPSNISRDYQSEIDSLSIEISKLEKNRDSIQVIRDTIEVQLKSNESNYEEVRNTILTNNTSEDYIFFTNYINRFDSMYNSRAAKDY